MDNEPGHKRKVFVLKVKTGSSLIPDEGVEPCAPLPSPWHSCATKQRLFLKGCWLRPTQLCPAGPPLESGSEAVSAQLGGQRRHQARRHRKTSSLPTPCGKHFTEGPSASSGGESGPVRARGCAKVTRLTRSSHGRAAAFVCTVCIEVLSLLIPSLLLFSLLTSH